MNRYTSKQGTGIGHAQLSSVAPDEGVRERS